MSRSDLLKRLTVTATAWLAVVTTSLKAEPPVERAVLGEGEVTRNDVYVRSGPSLNHYTICKLQAGDKVLFVGEQGEWFEILPPRGTFGLISGEFVDTTDGKTGVINAENVRVRAGSLLNESKYTVQMTVDRGTEVTILGRNPDGFVRIEPLPGATLWIHRSFVEPVPDALFKLRQSGSDVITDEDGAVENVAASTINANTTATDDRASGVSSAGTPADPTTRLPSETTASTHFTTRPEGAKPGAAVSAAGPIVGSPAMAIKPQRVSPLAGLPPTSQRAELQRIDGLLYAEYEKPVADRNLQLIIDQYRGISSQAEDELARIYAEKRIEQLSTSVAVLETMRRISGLTDDAERKRQQFLAERANRDYVPLPPVPSGFDAQGELRVSALYPPGTFPRKYRLVDPSSPGGQTIGYVELPPDSKIEIDSFLGRYVGVRAAERRLQIGGVNPVPVYLASELVLLQPTTPPTGSSAQQ